MDQVNNLLRSVKVFDKRFRDTDIDCVNAVADVISRLSAPYEAVATARATDASPTTCASIKIKDLTAVYVNWGVPMTGTALSDHNRFCISVYLDGMADTIDPHFGSVSTDPQRARVFNWAEGTQTTAPQQNKVLNFTLPMDVLEARVRTYTQNQMDQPLRFSPLVNLAAPSGAAIAVMIDSVLSQISFMPDGFDNALVATSMQEMVISSILSILDHNYKDQPGSRIDCAVPRTVKRAEDYMRAHADEPITVDVLAREADCSERALQNAFKAFRGTTPMGALRDIRLEMARGELRQSADTVAKIAFKWGFSNLGRFAAQYSAKYGERPCETARTVNIPHMERASDVRN